MNAIVPQGELLVLSEDQRTEITTQVSDAITKARKAKESAFAITEITDQADLEIATSELRDIASVRSKLEERRKSITRPMDEAKRFVMDLFAAPDAELAEGETHLRRLVQARLDEQARQEAERRRQAEADAQAARKAAEAALVAARSEEEAEAALEQVERADLAATPVVHLEQRPRGVSTAGKWVPDFSTIDMAILMAAAIKNPDRFGHFVIVDETKLRQYATMMKDKAEVPGVTFKLESNLRVRRS